MKHIDRWILLALVIAGLQLSACGSAPKTQKIQPFKLEAVEGTELKRVVLTAKAAERLDLQTVPVGSQLVNGSERKVIPYGAVLYDVQGGTWTYVSPEPLVFVREAIEIESLNGSTAVLTKGPELGTPVVTVGAAELYGAELGVSK
jgi:hypothetical protein